MYIVNMKSYLNNISYKLRRYSRVFNVAWKHFNWLEVLRHQNYNAFIVIDLNKSWSKIYTKSLIVTYQVNKTGCYFALFCAGVDSI